MRKKNHRYYTYYIIVALLAWLPTKSHAQFGINDMPSMEAMISNHKTVRTALDIRMIAELGVEQVHEGSQKSTFSYPLLILSTNSSGVSISIFEKPNHFLPKSLMDAPM